MKILFVLLTLCSFTAQAEDALERADKEYAAALDKAKKDYISKLQTELTTRTKAGDLDGALKVKDRITQVESGTALTSTTKKVSAGSPANTDGSIDLDKLTKDEWAKLPGSVIVVKAALGSVEVGTLAANQSAILVPHPEDRWSIGPVKDFPLTSYKGTDEKTYRDLPYSALVYDCGSGIKLVDGAPITGPMHVTVHINDNIGGYGDNTGSLRVKIVPVKR